MATWLVAATWLVVPWPETVSGWIGLAFTFLSLLALIFAAAMGLLNRHLNGVINDRVMEVRIELHDRLEAMLQARLDPILLQLTTMNGELARIRVIESQIENGLMLRMGRVEDKVDKITEHHMVWDGTNRRNGE